ncbi:MAG: 4-hydroxy-tetrahydrodipicolinate synthase [Acutalibacteraceae bacterium]|nr:4-hydroxy-tetrahydrodipicolinate synthase [Clostridia bacterium]MBQ2000888.1 4-hydroxy-tetrahydrodipicolinate synthase [Clostridia bacterium]MBQ2420253.1 4-hydroxy-tetrahydrodipicolinate synthase [Clostridia bacterium]MBQ5598021.1 4-hydroxy-tetrahydrodipicolinate synthase [Clostridia bacterium]MEE1128145.1 4-hydroxy-tetrahydrodipicolinate synthase [Acutalibacteraceae bacterium]
MKKVIFKGAAVALVTPMNEDGSVNYNKLKELVDQQIEGGTDAIVACGTTGEAATLDLDEHIEVIRKTVEFAAGRVPVIAGAGSNDTAFAIKTVELAEEAGVDGLLVVTPYYNKTSQAGLIAHFTKIAEATSLPIILYNVPSRTGVNIKPETYKELSKIENIVATKEASGDISAVAKIAHLCGDDLMIYSGNDDQIVPIMSLGGIGVISVLSNVCPKETHDICQYALDGDFKAAAALQVKYLPLIDALFSDVNPIPVKEAFNIMGYEVGECRLPLIKMSDSAHEALKAEMAKVGLVK